MWIIGRDGTLTETGACQIIKVDDKAPRTQSVNELDFPFLCSVKQDDKKMQYYTVYGRAQDCYDIYMKVSDDIRHFGLMLVARYITIDTACILHEKGTGRQIYGHNVQLIPHIQLAQAERDFVFDKLTTAIIENRPYFCIADAEKMFEAMVDTGWDTSLTNNEAKA